MHAQGRSRPRPVSIRADQSHPAALSHTHSTRQRRESALRGQRRAAETHDWREAWWQAWWSGYLAALAGVALVSLIIALIRRVILVEDISLLYLLVVLWLAIAYGRWPAIAASVLAFLTFDVLFIPPYFQLTVSDPAQWVSLFALLTVALAISQLTAAIRAHVREATESERRTAALYALAQLTASHAETESLAQPLAEQVARVFAPVGVLACALLLPDVRGQLRASALAPATIPSVPTADALCLRSRETAAMAAWASERGQVSGTTLPTTGPGPLGERVVFFIPLRAHARVIGVLALAGTGRIRALVERALPTPPRSGSQSKPSPEHTPQAQLFAAFRDQIALALERAALRQQAIHAEALRESDQLKDALLGSVTHDLQTPLAAITAATTSLLAPEMRWSEGERAELIEAIDTSANRLHRLVSNLLDLSRLESGAATPVTDWHLIGELIATVLDRLELAGLLRGHPISVELADDLPLARMDHTQIEQVLTNLIENAAKYSPAGSPILVRAERTATALEVAVRDHGIGIPAHELTAIFGKFYRVHQMNTPWSLRPPIGTGLGLAICAAIIAAHGGRIWAESAPGVGATFRLTLPLAADTPQGGLPELTAPTSRSSADV